MRTVMFLDGRTDEWSRIADFEVPPGSRRLNDANCAGEAWYLPAENWGSLRDDPGRQAEYDAGIAQIRATFAAYYPLTQSQWWEVIEGDGNPIASFERWFRAAQAFLEMMSEPAFRSVGCEVFNLLSTLVRVSPAEQPRVYRHARLTDQNVREIIRRFHRQTATIASGG